MEDFFEYFDNLKKKLILEKELKNFWTVCGNDSIKPFKNYSLQEFKRYLLEKVQYFKGKLVANIKFVFASDNFVKKSKKTDEILSIDIAIYKVNEIGEIAKSSNDVWGLLLTYNADELFENKITLKELAMIINLVGERKIITANVGGISYSSLIKKINDIS